MGKKYFVLGVIFLLIIFSVWAAYFRNKKNIRVDAPVSVQPEKISNSNLAALPADGKNKNGIGGDFLPPLDRAKERVTKKYFGLFITPQTSPVQPEHFTGFHTGTDFEIFSGEENIDVAVKAVCGGKLLTKKAATGYGGVMVESCELNGESITVVYGHMKLTSITYNAGDTISAGDTLGILGVAYSAETGGERKHLHLGFHKGTSINILGYVQSQAELSGWLDPCQSVCN